MTKSTDYLLDKSDDSKIESVAERLFQERDSLANTTIDWDDFTEKYMEFKSPNGDPLIRLQWINRRPSWIKAINRKFSELNHPCQLYVDWGLGVKLASNGEAGTKIIIKRTKKISSTLETTIDLVTEMQERIPEARKLLKHYNQMIIENMYAFSGRIDNSKLPSAIKKELKMLIQNGLPSSDED